MRIISRAEWGARAPKSTPVYVPPSKRQYYVLHHSGGPVDQTVRAIQDWCMDGRGFNDIDYNFLVRGSTGEIYEGRGWDVQGAHTVGYNTTGAGVCIIGFDQCSDAAKTAVRWLYGEYNQRCGRTLLLRGHRDLDPPRDCPGDHNEAWLKAGLPAPTLEGDMPLDANDHAGIRNDAYLGAGYDVGRAFVRATTGNPDDATATDRAIRDGWDAGMSFAIEIEYKALTALLQQVLANQTDDARAADVLKAINDARDRQIDAARQRFDRADAELAAARTDIAGVDEAVWSKVPDPGVGVAEKAALLRAVLGDQSAAVGTLLAGA